MKILVIAEHDHQNLKSVNRNVLSAAKELNGEIDVLLIGYQCEPVVEKLKKILCIHKVMICTSIEYKHFLAENLSEVIASVGKNYDYIMAGATTFGKNILPRVAAQLDVSMISDITQILSPNTFIRPVYAGNALATVESEDKIKVISVRSSAFKACEISEEHSIPVEKLELIIKNSLSTWLNQELTVSKRPELTSAKIVISGGRGLKSADNFKMLEKLADTLGAAIGASRAAVDAGFAPNDYQVGQTGKIVAPDLYIAVGISGAIQHLAGMKDSKIVVAINNDADAPIFQSADYGLVGDLFKILPELENEIKKISA